MRCITTFLLGSVVTGLLVFVVSTKYWDNKFEKWTSDFVTNNSKIEVGRELLFTEIMYEQVKNIKNNDLNEFNRKACRFLKISLNDPMVSDAYKNSNHFSPIANDALIYVRAQEELVNFCYIPNKYFKSFAVAHWDVAPLGGAAPLNNALEQPK